MFRVMAEKGLGEIHGENEIQWRGTDRPTREVE